MLGKVFGEWLPKNKGKQIGFNCQRDVHFNGLKWCLMLSATCRDKPFRTKRGVMFDGTQVVIHDPDSLSRLDDNQIGQLIVYLETGNYKIECDPTDQIFQVFLLDGSRSTIAGGNEVNKAVVSDGKDEPNLNEESNDKDVSNGTNVSVVSGNSDNELEIS